MSRKPERVVPKMARVIELLLGIEFVGFTLAAALWVWGMPHGFPWAHPRFFANGPLPALVSVGAGFGCVGLLLDRRAQVLRAQLFLAACCVGGAVVSPLLFPASFRGPFGGVVVLIGLGPIVLTIPLIVEDKLGGLGSIGGIILLGLGTGGYFVGAQKGPAARTRPMEQNESYRFDREGFGDDTSPVSPLSVFRLSTGEISIENGNSVLRVQPILEFESISPDRFWTILSPIRPARQMCLGSEEKNGEVYALYEGDVLTELHMKQVADTVWEVAARNELKREIYSHLNSYCVIHASGMLEPAIRFGDDGPVLDILPSDYPVGRPARFASIGDDDRLVVREARSGEKGPFKLLADSSLDSNQSIAITLYGEGRPRFRFVLRDFARHASRQLSPTAGWGVPENAIEFWLSENDVLIFFTLAGTSVGRGWDSVGHASGVYLNRMRIEALN